jgi:hypothetical protein
VRLARSLLAAMCCGASHTSWWQQLCIFGTSTALLECVQLQCTCTERYSGGLPHLLAGPSGQWTMFRGFLHALQGTCAVALAVVLPLALAATINCGFAARTLQKWRGVLFDVPTASSSTRVPLLSNVGHVR